MLTTPTLAVFVDARDFYGNWALISARCERGS